MNGILALEERLTFEYLKRKESRDIRTAKYFETRRLEQKKADKIEYQERLIEENRYEFLIEKYKKKNFDTNYMGLYFDFFA
jgi:hypothetical protein